MDPDVRPKQMTKSHITATPISICCEPHLAAEVVDVSSRRSSCQILLRLRYNINGLYVVYQIAGLHALMVLGTVFTHNLVLLPLVSDIPSTKTLMARIVACKVAILLEALLLVSA
ncbi:hypothetical protein C7974DRAFT_68137 [Boeremia exigua]|uniref:uncharacterized protein n=1 Tax=Boeremia exigua TaxID=749465 RepID=UPI001E8E91EA|nr:uncharacterized protein C7974DRAFT_68137 [Boeremia exigua]KAH6613991.1 hypothetical protein C7974DRAFT_68137 [Boeremia exigua]